MDSLTLIKLVNFHLSFNWSQDLLRDIFGNLENGELEDLVEDLVPFNIDHSHDLLSVLNDDDMKAAGLWSDESLIEKYRKTPKEVKAKAPRKNKKKSATSSSGSTAGSDDVLDTHSNLDDQMASNNWVISGEHTQTGKPLLASDPHLGTGIPSFWQIQHLEFNMEVNGKK